MGSLTRIRTTFTSLGSCLGCLRCLIICSSSVRCWLVCLRLRLFWLCCGIWSDKNRLILAGIVTGLVYQFHNVAFFCCYVAFAVCLLLNFKRFKFSYLYFSVPSVFALPFIFGGGPPLTFAVSSSFITNFAQNPFIYYFLNLGIPFMLAIVSFIKPGHEYLKITFLLLFLIPNILVVDALGLGYVQVLHVCLDSYCGFGRCSFG